jgi:hypothetical protein
MRLAAIACALLSAIFLLLADQLPATNPIATRACTAGSALAAIVAIALGIAMIRRSRKTR